jgi:predicted membrane chloride channel (bestrophin family)
VLTTSADAFILQGIEAIASEIESPFGDGAHIHCSG